MVWWQLTVPAIVGFTAFVLYSSVLKSSPSVSITVDTQGNQSSWNILQHLGGNSPWIPNGNTGVETDINPPPGCLVTQVHMMSRHGERYPTVNSGVRMLELYQRIQHANTTFHGDLAFLNSWNFFAPEPSRQFEQLVSTGPYAGTLQAFTTGVKLRTRYKALLDAAIDQDQTTFWASHSERVIETAKYFATGFFGLDWERLAPLRIIPESADRGGDTLTPGRACPNYVSNRGGKGHDYGAEQLYAFRSTYLPRISQRLQTQNPGIVFDDTKIYSMQEMCGFETMAVGRSDWCDVFTEDEWLSFEYARDLLHYYRAGPGNPHGPFMGWLWLNATANLLRQGPSAGPLFFSFDHDGDMVALLAAMDILHQDPDLPTSHVLHDRTWRLSDIVPMGGRITFERLSCVKHECWDNGPLYPNHVYCSPPHNETFVRLSLNDGITAMPKCEGGPGHSCPLERFLELIDDRGASLNSYKDICGLAGSAAEQIEFLHQQKIS